MFPVFMVYCSSFFPVDRNARRAPAPPRCLLSHFRTGGLPDIKVLFIYLKMSLFCLHLENICCLDIEFWVESFLSFSTLRIFSDLHYLR